MYEGTLFNFNFNSFQKKQLLKTMLEHSLQTSYLHFSIKSTYTSFVLWFTYRFSLALILWLIFFQDIFILPFQNLALTIFSRTLGTHKFTFFFFYHCSSTSLAQFPEKQCLDVPSVLIHTVLSLWDNRKRGIKSFKKQT